MTRQSILLGIASAREAIAAHRLRSALTLLGVSIGVASVLAIASYGEFASAQVVQVLAQFGANLVVVSPSSPLTRGARTGSVSTLVVDDAAAVRQSVPNLLACSGVRTGSLNAVAGRYSWNTQVAGVSTAFPTIEGLQVQTGRFFSSTEEQSTAPVATLGNHAAAYLFPGLDATAQKLRLNGAEFQVVGVLAPRGRSANGDLDDIIYVPLSTALRRLYGGIRLDRIEARVVDSGHMGAAMAAITSVLEQRHHIAAGKPDDFQVQNYQLVADRARQSGQVLSVGLTAAAVLALAIAGFGVMNIMLLSVSERTPEIGVRVAVGARSSDVRAQFLAEAVTLCLGGAVIGASIGTIGAAIISQRVGVDVVPPVASIAVAAAISAAIGLIFGLYPAERAARLDPITALREFA